MSRKTTGVSSRGPIDGLEALEGHLAYEELLPVYLVTSAPPPPAEGRKPREKALADPKDILRAARAIRDRALQGGDAAMDLVEIDWLDPPQSSGARVQPMDLVANEARSMSLFGGRRVIVVSHADALFLPPRRKIDGGGEESEDTKAVTAKKKASTPEILETLLGLAEPGTTAPFVLVFCAESIHRGLGVVKVIDKVGALVHVAPLDAARLEKYLADEGATHGIGVEHGVGARLVDLLGGEDSARLRMEADRLLVFAGPGQRVTRALVQEFVPLDRESVIWALSDALGSGDAGRAIAVVNEMIEHERHALMIVGYLASHYRKALGVLSRFERGETAAAIAHETRGNEWVVRKTIDTFRKGGTASLARALQSIDACDRILKSTRVGERKVAERLWIERLVVALARGEPMRRPTQVPGALDALRTP